MARAPSTADRRGLSRRSLRAHHARRPRRGALDRGSALGARAPWPRPPRSGATPSPRGSTPRRRSATGCSRSATRRCSRIRGRQSSASTAHLGLEGGIDEAIAAAGEVANLGAHDSRVGAGKWREHWRRRDLRDFDRVAGDLLGSLGYDQSAGVSAGSRRPRAAPARSHGFMPVSSGAAGGAVSRMNCSIAAAIAAASSGVAAPVRSSIRGRCGCWLPLRLTGWRLSSPRG